MTQLTGDWLTNPSTQIIFRLLRNPDHRVFAVGGCIRNELLGHPVNDVDFATDAHPHQVIALAEKAGLKAIPTGIEHGTVTVIAGDTGFEITTFRKDVQTNGRQAVVAYSGSLTDDAKRRDFTMNALYADQNGQISDPLGGLADIQKQCVRFIEDPHDRIKEDYLRILRFFRFHAWFGDPSRGFDMDALAACAELAEGLDSLSNERIGMEMRKLLMAPDPAPSVATMQQTGILMRLLPGATSASLAPLVHIEGGLGLPPSWLRRLACLGGENQTDALRLSRDEWRYLKLLQIHIGSTAELPELAYRHGRDAAIDIITLRAAMIGAEPPSDLISIAEHSASQIFPIKAKDITTGETGPALGEKLKHLENEWIASQFRKPLKELLA